MTTFNIKAFSVTGLVVILVMLQPLDATQCWIAQETERVEQTDNAPAILDTKELTARCKQFN